MSMRFQWAILVTAAMYPAISNAEIATPPGYRERELALIIRQAGYDCPQVESIEVATAPEPGWESFVSDPSVPPIMKEAGHKGRPQAAQLAGQCGS